jgi:malonyl-ACP O-methyltransferase BioC
MTSNKMELKKQIINCFNSGAYTYNAAADIQQIVARHLAERLAGVSASSILEIGCGTGLFSQYLPVSFPHAKILLTDIAPLMVQVCEQRFHTHPNIATACQDGEALVTPLQFDLIVSSMTLHWFTDFYASMAELITKLNSGGQFIFAMLGENSLLEWRDVCESDSKCRPTPIFPSAEAMKKYFPDLSLQVEVTPIAYADAYQFLKTLKSIGATAADINHITLSPGRLRRLMRAFDRTKASDIDVSYEIIYGCYTKP